MDIGYAHHIETEHHRLATDVELGISFFDEQLALTLVGTWEPALPLDDVEVPSNLEMGGMTFLVRGRASLGAWMLGGAVGVGFTSILVERRPAGAPARTTQWAVLPHLAGQLELVLQASPVLRPRLTIGYGRMLDGTDLTWNDQPETTYHTPTQWVAAHVGIGAVF